MSASKLALFFNRLTGLPRLTPDDLGPATSDAIQNGLGLVSIPFVYFTAKPDKAASDRFNIYAVHGNVDYDGDVWTSRPGKLNGSYTHSEAVDIIDRLSEADKKMCNLNTSNLNHLRKVMGASYKETSYRNMDLEQLKALVIPDQTSAQAPSPSAPRV